MAESRDLLGGPRLCVLGTARRRILPRRMGMDRRGLGFAVLVSLARGGHRGYMVWRRVNLGYGPVRKNPTNIMYEIGEGMEYE